MTACNRSRNGPPAAPHTVTCTCKTDLSGTLEGAGLPRHSETTAGGIGGLLARSYGYSGATGDWSTHHYYHADGGGNVTCLISTAQTVAATYRYDPFGRTAYSSGGLANANLFRFSSKLIHPDSGLYYYGYRFYDPDTQRWLNRDPIGETGSDNLCGSVRNEPVSIVDTLGLIGLVDPYPEWPKRPIPPDWAEIEHALASIADTLIPDSVECLDRCVRENDPFNRLVNPCFAKFGLGALGGTIPWTLLEPLLGNKAGTPLTTIPSLIRHGLVKLKLKPSRLLRTTGRFFSPVFIGYGLGMAGIEVLCAVQCSKDATSYD